MWRGDVGRAMYDKVYLEWANSGDSHGAPIPYSASLGGSSVGLASTSSWLKRKRIALKPWLRRNFMYLRQGQAW